MADAGRGCVFDTNVLIYHLHDVLDDETKLRLSSALEVQAVISVITRIELMCWPQHTADSLAATLRLLDALTEHPLVGAVVDRTIELRQATKLKLADAVIAATALELNLPLVTRNTRDFARVAGLELVEAGVAL
jgi:predicted nucleic acid-binding protein